MSSMFNPEPLWSAPPLATLLNLLVSFAVLGVTFWLARDAALENAFAAFVTLSVILFPLAIEYHYTLMLLPLVIMSARVFETRQRGDMVWLATIVILFYLPFDWNAPRWNAREFVLLAYPRLYGGWLLWLWLLKQMWLQNTATVSALPSNATR